MLPLLVFHLRTWGGAAWLFGFRWHGSAKLPDPAAEWRRPGAALHHVRCGKRDKDRRTVLPSSLVEPLKGHMHGVRLVHQEVSILGQGKRDERLEPPRRQSQPETIAPMEIRLRPGMGQGPVADPLAHLIDHRRQAHLQGKTCHPGFVPTGHLA